MAPKRQTLAYENEDLDRIAKFQGRGKRTSRQSNSSKIELYLMTHVAFFQRLF
jgi:hypothetical protein